MSYVGNLVGNQWQQYSNDAGQMYYVEVTTGATQYAIPSGWEDQAGDNWNHSAAHQQWINTRTGRIIFENPNPPPARTYLEKRNVMAHLQTVERKPGADESTYRNVTTGILRWLFPEDEGFDVVQNRHSGNGIIDDVVFKVECIQGPPFDAYDFLIVECIVGIRKTKAKRSMQWFKLA
ncbi:Ff.00g113130.m01.CDS01 [Fusarium sp. VM40]|nr:Ff.00g113130.m01.CDS01 [Fusarium sp. VM40]